MEYYRVTIKDPDTGKRTSFWAKIEAKNDLVTLYLPLKKDGDDLSYYDKNDACVIVKRLVGNSLIVSEKPARMNRTYCELEVIK